MEKKKSVIGITMGDPVGIGPEIIVKALQCSDLFGICRPIVFGDLPRLMETAERLGSRILLKSLSTPQPANGIADVVDVVNLSQLNPIETKWGQPTSITGQAMIGYINQAVDFALERKIDAVVTAPINKTAMKMAGSEFAGHTELLAARTGSNRFAMMMAGSRLRVVLATIHIPLGSVAATLSKDRILETIEITQAGLIERFGIEKPRIAVAALNPHAGEAGLFGEEETQLISPACRMAAAKGIPVAGPLPPDTVFYQAIQGYYDAVVCMYHDQGLIPFKMIHFTDGVNTTLGLPIIRTSVDHGTAYDIAGTGQADPGSLVAAIRMAAIQASVTGQA